MKKIQLTFHQKQITSPITIGQNLLTSQKIKTFVPRQYRYFRRVLITDTVVQKMCGKRIAKLLGAEVIAFPAGETYKTQATVSHIQDTMLEKRYARDTVVIALGGGVVGDLAGYVAATYMRGVPYINIPTTLLAMVDSAIGGKTGVDTAYGKNTVGAFYQPVCTIMDTSFVYSLPHMQFVNGLLEAIKSFFTSDASGLKLLSKLDLHNPKNTPSVVDEIIFRSVQFKAGVVMRDEREGNERRVLNFGHTIGHALELLSGYAMPHGYAVGYGILAEAKIAELLKHISPKEFHAIAQILEPLGIDKTPFRTYSASTILRETYGDKKVLGGKPRYVLLSGIGKVYCKRGQYAHEVSDRIVMKALEKLH